MTLALIISPYNAPTTEARAANVRLGIALARWAAAQGYTPVGWWCDVDPNDPPADDPETRAAALARSAERARMVGAAGGVAVLPAFVKETAGMHADVSAWLDGRGPWDGNRRLLLVFREDIPPYLLPDPAPTVDWFSVLRVVAHRIDEQVHETLGDPGLCADADVWSMAQKIIKEEIDAAGAPEPVPTVPRAAVQAAADEIRIASYHGDFYECVYNDILANHTGVTPSEVQ